ncbi:MAG TPA: DmsE family decaheme c-type cytochrome [Terriglobales bacterium]|nr:DmsE family decaheme c-type cytochrome [Terriglobales bacterium]
MMRKGNVITGAVWLLLPLLLMLAPAAVARMDESGKSRPAVENDSQYAGSESCRGCHEDLYKQGFKATPHSKTTLKGQRGCESCHGPGAEHVAAGGDTSKIITFKKLSKEEANARCLSCHSANSEQEHFRNSAHATNDVGCLDCHSPHHAKQEQALLVTNQPQLCYQCHTAEKAEFARPYHHRVNEGFVRCADCHNVHGSSAPRQARTVANGDAACYKCHVDKHGPFAFEHVPVKTEGCISCHTPHGSNNPRFLRVSQVNLLCLQCHTVPTQSPIGPAHNLSAKYQACTMCHPAIHGSNSSNAFLR